MKIRFNIFFFFSLLLIFSCTTENENTTVTESEEQKQESKLGVVSFNFTGNDEAQIQFKKGLLFLHSFEYENAREAFQQTQALDSNFYMAYWGEAMTHNHPLWSRSNLDEAKEVLKKLGDTKEHRLNKAPNDYEKDFYNAVEVLYGEGDKIERDDAYAEYMGKLHTKYPDDNEITTFYALSLLGSVEDGRDVTTYEKGASLVQEVLDKNPNHPGALHYLIHSFDDPEHAHKALFAANKYSKIAPDAQHALHMPSHIFIALGDWDNVINSNIAAYDASKRSVQEKNLTNDKLGFHSLHWLIYGHLQKGEVEKAEKLLRELESSTAGISEPNVASYRTMIESTFRTEIDNWDSTFLNLESDISELSIIMQVINLQTKARIALANNNLNSAKSIVDTITKKRKEAEKLMLQQGAKMCNGVGWYNQLPTKVDVNQAHILDLEIRALIASAEKNDLLAEDFLKQAMKIQDETSFSYGPPIVAKPSYEMYADWLVTQGREDEAKIQYAKSLEKAPGRRLSLK